MLNAPSQWCRKLVSFGFNGPFAGNYLAVTCNPQVEWDSCLVWHVSSLDNWESFCPPSIDNHLKTTWNYTHIFTKSSQLADLCQGGGIALLSTCGHPDHSVAKAFTSFSDEPYLNPSGVWLEASGWVFGRHSALDRTAVHPDLVLFEAEFWQAAALTHMQLGMHQVHTVIEREATRWINWLKPWTLYE